MPITAFNPFTAHGVHSAAIMLHFFFLFLVVCDALHAAKNRHKQSFAAESGFYCCITLFQKAWSGLPTRSSSPDFCVGCEVYMGASLHIVF